MSISALAIDEALQALTHRQPMSAEMSERVFRDIMSGACSEMQLAGLLVGMAARGENIQEIVGAARAMRSAVIPVNSSRVPVIDTCGTGGSGIPRRNVSTAVAFAVAACGVAVAKHGNRAASSKSGSADVLEALGVNISSSPEVVSKCIDELGVGFLFAKELHPAMKYAAPVRRGLKIRTVFNLLGPMTNPAGAKRQVMGVYDPRRAKQIATALGELGSERVFVVHGFRAEVDALQEFENPASDFIDDLSTEGESLVCEYHQGKVIQHVLTPEVAGLQRVSTSELAGGSPEENAKALRAVLKGEKGAYRSAVEYGGALSLLVAKEDSIERLPDYAKKISESLDSGAALSVLDKLIELSHRPIQGVGN